VTDDREVAVSESGVVQWSPSKQKQYAREVQEDMLEDLINLRSEWSTRADTVRENGIPDDPELAALDKFVEDMRAIEKRLEEALILDNLE
jgi:hypothetical protein